MKWLQTWRWMTAAALLAAARTEGIEIQSFDGTGQIVFDAAAGTTNYEVRAASAPTGSWDVVGNVAPSAANSLTTTVCVAGTAGFYQVLAYRNETPEAGKYLLVDLSGGPSATNYPVRYLSAVPPGGWTDAHRTDLLVLRRIPATDPDFTMGSPEEEVGRFFSDDETQHAVELTQDFYIGVFEVTQRQWELVMDDNPSYFTNATHYATRPVEQVSYYDIRENPANSPISPTWPESSQVHAESFMGRLRTKTGLSTFDLPTESQWEYACRAGTTNALNSGYDLTDPGEDPRMSEVGRYSFNGGSGTTQDGDTSVGTARVGSFLANAWGLYDMHGNVWERCLDWYGPYPETAIDPVGADSGSFRVIRGGSWYNQAYSCRSALRLSGTAADNRDITFGFRAALVP